MTDIDSFVSVEGKRKSKRSKMTEESLPVLLIVHGYSVSELGMYVSNHPVLDNVRGHFSANKRIGLFYTDEMHRILLEELREDIGQLGDSDDDDYSKVSTLYELFAGDLYGGRRPRRGEAYSATIHMHIEPARFRFLK